MKVELSPAWEYVSDRVMGGLSTGKLELTTVDGRAIAHLRGSISLENNGGFVQMAFDLTDNGQAFDASKFTGFELEAKGNGQIYDLRLRTTQLNRPWQSFRSSFTPGTSWQTLRFPFAGFVPHRTDASLDPSRLRRVGVLAIGRAFEADVSVRSVALCR